MFLTILLAGAINAGPSPVDWLQQLQAEPFERSMPKAVIIQTREFAASTAISLYETRSADGTGTESSIWHARARSGPEMTALSPGPQPCRARRCSPSSSPWSDWRCRMSSCANPGRISFRRPDR